MLVRDGEVLGEGWHERPGGGARRGDGAAARGRRARRDRLRQPRAVRAPRAHAALRRRADRGRRRAGRDRRARPQPEGGRQGPRAAARGRGRGRGGRRRRWRPPPAARTPRSARASCSAARTSPTRRRPRWTAARRRPAGESQWISSPESRRLVHEWRAGAGAVAVGSGTALRDRPAADGARRRPAGRAPAAARRVRPRRPASTRRRWDGVVARGDAAEELAALARPGRHLGAGRGRRDARRRGCSTAGLIDRVALFVAPLVLGDGPGVFAGWAAGSLAAAPPRCTWRRGRWGRISCWLPSFGRYEVFTGIVVELGTVRAARARPGAGGAAGRGRRRRRRLGVDRGLLPDGHRGRAAAAALPRGARDAAPLDAGRPARPATGSTSSRRCASATGWAATGCRATWTGSAAWCRRRPRARRSTCASRRPPRCCATRSRRARSPSPASASPLSTSTTRASR